LIVKVQKNDFNIDNEIDFLKDYCSKIPGAISIFVGYVRDFTNNKKLTSMTIEQYPGMTEIELKKISQNSLKRWPLLGTLIIHRYGKLEVSEKIVLTACASLHRQAAFEANQFLMDFLKTKAPFWKSEKIGKKNHWVKANETDFKVLEKW
jgi:molybdopterin synthase catalytic subunit